MSFIADQGLRLGSPLPGLSQEGTVVGQRSSPNFFLPVAVLPTRGFRSHFPGRLKTPMDSLGIAVLLLTALKGR